MKQNITNWALSAGIAAILGLSMLSGEASAQNKRYSIPQQPTAKVQPASSKLLTPPATTLKPAVTSGVRIAPPPTMLKPAVQPASGAGMVAAGGLNRGNGAGMVAAGGLNRGNGAGAVPTNAGNVIGGNGASMRR